MMVPDGLALIWQQDICDRHDVVGRSNKNQAQSYDYDGVKAERGLTSHLKHEINTMITAKENTIQPWAFVWDIRYFCGSFFPLDVAIPTKISLSTLRLLPYGTRIIKWMIIPQP